MARFIFRSSPAASSATGDDLHSQPVAVVSRSFAARYFPGENPLGKHIRMGAAGANQTPWLTIVGVVEETTYSLWLRERPAAVYMDVAQLPPDDITYAITTLPAIRWRWLRPCARRWPRSIPRCR